MNADLSQMLIEGVNSLGVRLTERQAEYCMRYLAELKRWNRRINLTAIRKERDIVVKHFLDSFAFLKGFRPSLGMKLIDLGSGAGFPALPLKIVCPEISVYMVESVNKKAAFLRHIVRTLQLEEVEVLCERIDRLGDFFRSAFDVVTARAFGSLDVAISSGAPLLRKGGLIVLSRGPEETMNKSRVVDAGLTIEKAIRLTLPWSDYERQLWVLRKDEQSAPEYDHD